MARGCSAMLSSTLRGLTASELIVRRLRAGGKEIRTLGPPKRIALRTDFFRPSRWENRVDSRGAWNWRALPPSLGAIPPRCPAGRGTEDDQQIHDGLCRSHRYPRPRSERNPGQRPALFQRRARLGI